MIGHQKRNLSKAGQAMPQQDKDLILHQPRKPLPQSPHILALPQQQLSDDPPDLLQLPSISLLPAMS